MEDSMISSGTLTRAPEVITQHVKDQTVLFDMASGHYFALNELGARTWELIDGNRTVSEIASILALEYDAPLEVITEDITLLIEHLSAEELLVESKG